MAKADMELLIRSDVVTRDSGCACQSLMGAFDAAMPSFVSDVAVLDPTYKTTWPGGLLLVGRLERSESRHEAFDRVLHVASLSPTHTPT